MSRTAARWLFGAFLLAYTVFLTWPGILVANRPEPRILGLPLIFFWVVAWVGSATLVLFVLHRAENRHRARNEQGAAGRYGGED